MEDLTQTARECFSADQYAIKTTGVKIEKVTPGYCLCSLAIDERHLNNNGDVMGGALFTLADYAFGTAVKSTKLWPEQYGVLGDYVPNGFVKQLKFPFTWKG